MASSTIMPEQSTSAKSDTALIVTPSMCMHIKAQRNANGIPSMARKAFRSPMMTHSALRWSHNWPKRVPVMTRLSAGSVMAASTEESNEAQMRTISKLLYSALAAIEQAAGVRREELGGEHYMGRALDPHALVAGAMKERAA